MHFQVLYKSIAYALCTSWRWLNSSILPTNSIFIYLDYKFPSKIRLKILFADNYQENCDASVNYARVELLLPPSAQPPSFLLWVCFMPVSSFIGASSSHLLLCGAAVPTLWQQQWLERRSAAEKRTALCTVSPLQRQKLLGWLRYKTSTDLIKRIADSLSPSRGTIISALHQNLYVNFW